VRRPQVKHVPKSAKYPRGKKYYGPVEYRGKQKWVGTFATRREWDDAADEVEAELRAAVDRERNGGRVAPIVIPTVAEFAGVQVVDGGRVVPRDGTNLIWPETHPRDITKDSSLRVNAENLRPFVRAYGERRLDSFSRPEARAIAGTMTNGQKAAVRRFFGDALDDEFVPRNFFERLTVKQATRLAREGFELLADDVVERMLEAALHSRVDDYGLVIFAIIVCEDEVGIRPSEIFGIEQANVDRENGLIQLVNQIDSRGKPTPLKGNRRRPVPLTDRMQAALDRAPLLSDRWQFTAPEGGPLKLSLWDRYWNPVRIAAGVPGFEFYELKHRAITRMCTPEPDGYGIDPRDVALIVGHNDGGATIRKHYLQLDERKAIARFHSARARFRSEQERV
jgi:integrase